MRIEVRFTPYSFLDSTTMKIFDKEVWVVMFFPPNAPSEIFYFMNTNDAAVKVNMLMGVLP